MSVWMMVIAFGLPVDKNMDGARYIAVVPHEYQTEAACNGAGKAVDKFPNGTSPVVYFAGCIEVLRW